MTALVICIGLSRSPPVVARTNGVPIEGTVKAMTSAGEACQDHEVLPSGTTAIRVSLEALLGPRVRVRVARGGELLASGERSSGWTRQNVTITVPPLRRAVSQASVCFSLAPKDETVDLVGGRSSDALVTSGGAGPGGPPGSIYLPQIARPAAAAIRIEYLRPGARTWWSLALEVARRMGLGRAPSGTWIALATMVAMATVVAIVSWLLVRSPR